MRHGCRSFLHAPVDTCAEGDKGTAKQLAQAGNGIRVAGSTGTTADVLLTLGDFTFRDISSVQGCTPLEWRMACDERSEDSARLK